MSIFLYDGDLFSSRSIQCECPGLIKLKSDGVGLYLEASDRISSITNQ